jgi:acyl carrier protein/SAM-dependent methyltransferase
MNEQLIQLAHSFVAFPVIAALGRRGLFRRLRERGSSTLSELVEVMDANSGHLHVALRLLRGLGWLRLEPDGSYAATPESRHDALVPDDLLAILEIPLADCMTATDLPGQTRLLGWLERSLRGWDLPDPDLAALADGLLLTSILVARHLIEGENPPAPAGPLFGPCAPPVRRSLEAAFVARGWAERGPDGVRATPAGESLLERSLVLGTTVSYRPLLAKLPELLFGDPRRVMDPLETGEERHVDRTLNVVASGFQHGRFFADVDELIVELFDRPDIEEQPDYVADMGCGDGTFLRRIYETVRTRTARGRVLDRHPLRMIGIDYNREALTATAKTLDSIPHLLVRGDVGSPSRLLADLRSMGIEDTDRILHVRSFLDHDRPYQPPLDPANGSGRALAATSGAVAVDRSGRDIPAEAVLQSLVEHLGRWSDVSGRHGLIVVEVHGLAPEVAGRHRDRSESLHFDAYHGFSGQQLVEAGGFLLAAAGARLFPRLPYAARYPRHLPFTRITWNWLERRPYRIRPATAEDIPALLHLEEECYAPTLRLPEPTMRSRLAGFPGGHLVVEWDGRVVAVVYTQRITDPAALKRTPYAAIDTLHRDDATVVQLLGLNVQPDFHGQGLSDALLRFVLHWSLLLPGVERVVGVTRCRDYRSREGTSISRQVESRDEQGAPLDAVLRFHHGHGARILGPVAGYRPEDVENEGHGVLIEYDLREVQQALMFPGTPAPSATPVTPGGILPGMSATDVGAGVEQCVRRLLHQAKQADYSPRRPFLDLGLDSLDLMELRAMLGGQFGLPLEPTVFFRHPTPEALTRYLEERLEPAAGGAASRENGRRGADDGPVGDPAADDPTLLDLIAEIQRVPEGELARLLADDRLVGESS